MRTISAHVKTVKCLISATYLKNPSTLASFLLPCKIEKKERESKTHFLLQDFTETEDLTNCGAIKNKKKKKKRKGYANS